MRSVVRTASVLGALGVLAFVLAPAQPPPAAEAQGNIWTSCRNVCMRSCQWDKRVMSLPADDKRVTTVGNQCWESVECKALEGYFAPSDPKIDRDATTAAMRLGQCKRCAAGGKQGRCPATMFGGAGYGGTAYGGTGYGGGRDRIGDFARCFESGVRDRIAEGYHVKNYAFVRHVRRAASASNPFLDKTRGGRSGEYGAWGQAWIKPCADQLFPGALVDDILVEDSASAHKKRVGDQVDAIYEASHRATRVVLPDGRRFVVDYWDAIASGQPQLQTQTAWVKKWRDRVGVEHSVVTASDAEKSLAATIKRLGEDKGFALFRKQNKGAKHGSPELWIQSWKREPW